MTLPVRIRRLAHAGDLPVPAYESAGAAGADLRAAIAGPMVLQPAERRAVPTGFAIAVPEGYELQVRPRSGLALRDGLTVLNAPGTVDADYRGEVMVILINLGAEAVTIGPGERIAQAVLAPVIRASFEEVPELDDTPRGGAGFGSTGR